MVRNVSNLEEQTRKASVARSLKRDLKTLLRFVSIYCKDRHAHRSKSPVLLKTHDVSAIAGRPVSLCPACYRLLAHAFMKRTNCPLDPKPACKHCPQHCYHSTFRRKMQRVMRYSGRAMLLSGRLDYLLYMIR